MHKIIKLFVVCCGIGLAPSAFAEADVGDPDCRQLQLEAQQLGDEANNILAKNHGQWMKLVTRITSPELEAENITEECSSCIVSQYARRIPVAEQVPCGPVTSCEPQTCGNFTLDCDEAEGANCVGGPVFGCVETADGKGACVANFFCSNAAPCPNGHSDCVAKEIANDAIALLTELGENAWELGHIKSRESHEPAVII